MNCCFGSIYPQDVDTDREFQVPVGDEETLRMLYWARQVGRFSTVALSGGDHLHHLLLLSVAFRSAANKARAQ